MTLAERIERLEVRLREQRDVLAAAQRGVFQLEGAIFALRELLAEAPAAPAPNGPDPAPHEPADA